VYPDFSIDNNSGIRATHAIHVILCGGKEAVSMIPERIAQRKSILFADSNIILIYFDLTFLFYL